MPTGAHFFTSFTDAVQGSTIEKTFCSRMRRAMSCVYCAPKSRMTMDWFSGDWLALDWDSTDEFLKSDGSCKGEPRAWVVTGDIAYNVSAIANQAASTVCGTAWQATSLQPGSAGR